MDSLFSLLGQPESTKRGQFEESTSTISARASRVSRWEPRTHLEDGTSELLKEYDTKHGIEVSSQVPQVREGGGPSQKNETRKRNRP